MSDWSESAADAAEVIQSVFGGSFTYYPNHGVGEPVAITAIRVRRSADEFGRAGAFEGIEIQEQDFTDLPAAGDVVTVDGTDYVITDLRESDAEAGAIVLVLNRRAPLHPQI